MPIKQWSRFFEDIRDTRRRLSMVTSFKTTLTSEASLRKWLAANLRSTNCNGVLHQRCWVFELLVLHLGMGLKEVGRLMYTKGKNSANLQDPAGHFALRSDRFLSANATHSDYVDDVASIAIKLGVLDKPVDDVELSIKLLRYRVDAAIKLQKLNPLYAVIEQVTKKLGIRTSYGGIPSLLGDLSGSSDPVGRFELFTLQHNKKSVA